MCNWNPIAVVLIAVVLAGCGSAEKTAVPAPAASANPVTIIGCSHGNDPTLNGGVVKLIKSADELAALGAESLAGLNVDFAKTDLVVLALGEQPSDGYWAHVTGVQGVGDRLYVQGVVNAPGYDDQVSQTMTYPYCAATIAKTSATTALGDVEAVSGHEVPILILKVTHLGDLRP